eukprot:15346492-Ditylum_brightwellii.AAC.1
MSLSMLRMSLKVHDADRDQVHENLAILIVPDEESMANTDKVDLNLKVYPTATGNKNNVTKNSTPKFK